LQADIPVFVDHVAFRMPVLVLAIEEYLDKLLQDGAYKKDGYISAD
jgi:hypothetical protein